MQKLVPLKQVVALMASVLILTACQSTAPVTSSPVIQRPNQTFETTGTAGIKAQAKKLALDSATETCRKKTPIIIDDELIYNGVISESFGRMITQTTKAATAIMGKKSPDLSRDDTYEYVITFKCQ